MNTKNKATCKNIEEIPVSAWVKLLSEGKVVYQQSPRSKKETKKEFFECKKTN